MNNQLGSRRTSNEWNNGSCLNDSRFFYELPSFNTLHNHNTYIHIYSHTHIYYNPLTHFIKRTVCVLKVKFLFGMNMKCLLCLPLLVLITTTCNSSVMSYNTEESYNNVIRPQRPFLTLFLGLDTWIDGGSCEFKDYTINAFLWIVIENYCIGTFHLSYSLNVNYF